MIGKSRNEEVAGGGLHNALSPGTTVKGDIITETDFRLDGQVEGNITCNGKIVVGEKGRVIGNISSENAEIHGLVEGVVRVATRLTLKGTSIIKGDIFTQLLEIEPNARFDGSCTMSNSAAKAPAGK